MCVNITFSMCFYVLVTVVEVGRSTGDEDPTAEVGLTECRRRSLASSSVASLSPPSHLNQ